VAIEIIKRNPKVCFKSIKSRKNLVDARIELGSNIWIFFSSMKKSWLAYSKDLKRKLKRPKQKNLKKSPKLWTNTLLNRI